MASIVREYIIERDPQVRARAGWSYVRISLDKYLTAFSWLASDEHPGVYDSLPTKHCYHVWVEDPLLAFEFKLRFG